MNRRAFFRGMSVMALASVLKFREPEPDNLIAAQIEQRMAAMAENIMRSNALLKRVSEREWIVTGTNIS